MPNETSPSMYENLMQTLRREEFQKKKSLLHFEGFTLNVKKFIAAVDKAADMLNKLGISKGDVVAMNLPNTINAIVLFYSVNKLGAIASLVHPLLPVDAVNDIAKTVGAKLFITLDDYYEKNRAKIMQSNVRVLLCRISDYLPLWKKIIYKRKEPKRIENTLYYRELLKETEKASQLLSVYNDAAVYLHSAGTTGKAKTVILSNNAMNSLSDSLLNIIPGVDVLRSKCIMVLPLFHGFGLGVCMHTMLAHGAEVIVVPKFNAQKFASSVGKYKATICAGVPIMFEKMYKLPQKKFSKLSCLENIFVGGEKLSFSLKEKFDKRLKQINSKAELLEGYGLTETVTVCCVNKPDDYSENCVGYPLDCVEIAVVNEQNEVQPFGTKGEICVTGATLMNGYLDQADNSRFIEIEKKKCSEAGAAPPYSTCEVSAIERKRYLKTGDIGYQDEKGRVFFVDRIKRIIKINGITVFPNEIENAIKTLPFVSDCAAVYFEGRIKAFAEVGDVLLHTDETKQKITEVCRKKLIPYAIPKELVLIRAFPRNQVGKIDINKTMEMQEANL